MAIIKDIAGIAKGMSITFREMFKPTVVENYPDGKGPLRGAVFQERFRGVHVLQRDENGLEKCVACFLCAAACPSNCIYIEAAENTAENRISGAERYAKVYNIDYNRCIFCGYCVEACPTDAITHGHGFELATYDINSLVYRKDQMLEKVGGDMLVLGPFKGAMTPHTRIPLNQGICGAAASSGQTIVIDDVHNDSRYLACSIETKSEIVVPVFVHGKVVGELDIDSHFLAAFGPDDRTLCEHAAAVLGKFIESRPS